VALIRNSRKLTHFRERSSGESFLCSGFWTGPWSLVWKD